MSSSEQEVSTDYEIAGGAGGLDREWYLATYPDVARAGQDPVEHYVRHGWQEGRDPRADFSTRDYLAAHADVAGNPLVHHLRHRGEQAAQSQRSAEQDLASGEGGVDRAWYLQTYPDVAAAGVDPVEHYLTHGWRERRDPRADFSTSGYLRVNPDLDGNPLIHYLEQQQLAPDAETLSSEWHALWKRGLLYPQSGHAPPAHGAFGSPGVEKLLFTGHEASRSGAPLILLRLMQALRERTGAELFLILERGGPLLEDYQRIAHVIVNQNEMLYLSSGPDLGRLLAAIADPAPQLALCNCADGWRLAGALRRAGMPHLVSLVHERVVHYPADVWRSIHRDSDRVVFSAAAVKSATAAMLPEFNDALVVPQGLLDPDFGHGDRNAARSELRRKLGLAPDCVVVLGCGTRELRKGIDLFVQLAARVRARTTRDVHFLWIGAEHSTAYFARLIQLDITLLNLASAITLFGEVTDSEPYFLAADAFALTSRDDPFPCVIHEAMACALPAIVFDGAGGAKEALADGCGIVVPYLDIEAMAAALASIVKDPARFAAMGAKAAARVRSVYRFSDYAERIRELCARTSSEPARAATCDTSGKILAREPDRPAHNIPAAPAPLATDARADRLGAQATTIRWRRWLTGIARTVRAEQWWGHKLAPMYAVFYATAYINHASVTALWLAAVALLLAIAPCAAYVSLINDVTDRADDRRAGKENRLAHMPVWQLTLLLAAPLCVAAAFAVRWRDDVALVAAYLGAWLAFSLYSIAPLRLKTRGALGLIADACGSHVFPALTAALLALRASGNAPVPIWIGAVALWAFGYGLRGILWHQLYDFEADRKAAVRTFVIRHSRAAAWRVARFALLIELIGLAALLWQVQSAWPVGLLAIYALFAAWKSRAWNVAIVIAQPRERYAILGQEYYTVLFPLGVLLACALRNPLDWMMLGAHLAVFAPLTLSFAREAGLLAGSALHGKASALRGTKAFPATIQAHEVGGKAQALESAATPSPAAGTLTMQAAIDKSVAFLRECLRSGHYGLACRGSDGAPRFSDNKGHVFVASFMVEAMTGLLDEIERTIVLVRILSEENEGVWGFSPPGPHHGEETRVFHVDSDDSAYVIRTLQRLGVNRAPQCLLRFYRAPERLFVTFDAPGATALSLAPSPRNNLLAHTEVNANVFLALRGTHLEQFVNYEMLLQAQDERGFWQSYFYPNPLFATLLVLDLTHGHPAFAAATERALAFIVAAQNADGSWGSDGDPYATALAVAALAAHPQHAATMRRGVEHLLAKMAADGSWTSRACVWEFHMSEQDVWRAYDTQRAYVTARCLIALRRAAAQL